MEGRWRLQMFSMRISKEREMQNLLITGGAGFIGSNFIRNIQISHPEVRMVDLDLLTYAGSLENLKDLPFPERHIFVEGDICDQKVVEKLLRDYQIDTIIHFAAESHVDRSISGPAQFVHTNILGTFSLLEAVHQVWLNEGFLSREQVRFHHVSTDEVFGSLGAEDPAFSEVTPYSPRSPYSASKASSDHLVRAYFHTYGLPVTITNCSNNYGPYQFPEKLIPLFIINAIEGKPLPVYGDGKQIRDWLYVEDHCRALSLVVEKGRIGETYNIGGGNQPTNLELIEMICNLLDEELPDSKFVPHKSLIQYVTDRQGHDRRYAIDIRKIQNELGWQPVENLESGLRRTVKWIAANPDWVSSMRNKFGYQEWLKKNYTNRGEKKQ
jgi:dTDP-glucose 4,6-dehydratase